MSMIMRGRGFTGGYRFVNFAGAPEQKVDTAAIPGELIVPLKQGFGEEVEPTVKVGDPVQGGQVIGIDEGSVSTPVHAPASGRVSAVKTVRTFHGQVSAVFIETDGNTDWRKIDIESGGNDADQDTISRILYGSGVSSLGRSGIPTAFGSSVIGPGEVEQLILEGVGSDVYNESLDFLLEGDGLMHFLQGIKILKRLMHNARVSVALNRSRSSLLRELQEREPDLDLYPLEPRYPQHVDEVLVQTILNRPFPFGYPAAHIGVVVLDLQAVFHVYDAVVDGKPLIERIVALCGGGFSHNRYVKARIGTPVKALLPPEKAVDTRLIADGPISGAAMDDPDASVERDLRSITAIPERKTSGFLSFAMPGFRKDSITNTFVAKFLRTKKTADTNLHGDERPCIFCGYCEQVCPVGIVPHLLYRHVERGKIEDYLVRYGIFRCIDCGLCSYVCPSKIRLSHYLAEGKEELRKMGLGESVSIAPRFSLRGIDSPKDDGEGAPGRAGGQGESDATGGGE
jgi:electron transport complex protein RnfC